jgi:hypothetical protein
MDADEIIVRRVLDGDKAAFGSWASTGCARRTAFAAGSWASSSTSRGRAAAGRSPTRSTISAAAARSSTRGCSIPRRRRR